MSFTRFGQWWLVVRCVIVCNFEFNPPDYHSPLGVIGLAVVLWLINVLRRLYNNRERSYDVVAPTDPPLPAARFLGLENSNYVEMSDIVSQS
jgi:hypothetical protein